MSALTRREMLKLGVFGSAALALPIERVARAELQQANRLDPSRLPAVGQLRFRVPPDATPAKKVVTVPGNWIDPANSAAPTSVEIDYYALHMRQVAVPILPGLPPTVIWGYQGVTPGPTLHVERGRPVIVRHFNDMAEQHPVLRYGRPQTSVHLHGSASLPQYDGYASDITRRAEEGLPVPELPAGPDALVPRPRSAPHRAERLLRAGLAVPPARRGGAGVAAAGRSSMSPIDHLGHDVRRERLAAVRRRRHSGLWGDVILVNGQPWPVMQVKKRNLPVPLPERLDCPGPTGRSHLARRADASWWPPTAG